MFTKVYYFMRAIDKLPNAFYFISYLFHTVHNIISTISKNYMILYEIELFFIFELFIIVLIGSNILTLSISISL